jgi:hypothetical protein
MLTYYIKEIPNIDPLKSRVVKLTFTKIALNVNGTTIHYAFPSI